MNRVLQLTIATGLIYAVAGAIGCSGGGTSKPAAVGQGGATVTGGTTAISSGGMATMGGSGGVTAMTTGVSGGTTAVTGGSTGLTGDAGSSYPNVGVCGERGQATADTTSFDGYEERYIIGDSGFGSEICVIRFDLKRVGDAPAGCTVCLWAHLLEYSNPRVMTDINGVCAKSDLALDSAAMAQMVGARVAIGFADKLQSAHGSSGRMKYFENTNTWDVVGGATWDETTNAFKYGYRNGICNYGS